MEVVDMDLEDGELDSSSPPVPVWSDDATRGRGSDFSFLFGHRDIDLRSIPQTTFPPVLSYPQTVPPLTAPLTSQCLNFPDPQLAHRLDVDARFPQQYSNGFSSLPAFSGQYLPAHIPLQALHPNISHQSLYRPVAAAAAAAPVRPAYMCQQSHPVTIDLTLDEETDHQSEHQQREIMCASSNRRKFSVIADMHSMRQTLDRDPAPLSPYEPSDSPFIPITDTHSRTPTPFLDESVDELLETALVQKTLHSNVPCIKKKERQTPVKDNKRHRPSHSNGTSHSDKRRKSSDNRDNMYQYKDITVIDQRKLRVPEPGQKNQSPASSNSRSRRKLKRQQARAVHTVTADAAPDQPAASEQVPDLEMTGDMRDAPIEVLMAHVERIKNKLLALSEKEKTQEIASPAEHERSASRTMDSPATRDDPVGNNDEDDDIGELRRIAILSMKAKALEDSATAISSPAPLVSTQAQLQQADDDPDEDVDFLRQQLLMSMRQNQEKRTKAGSSAAPAPSAVLQQAVVPAAAEKRVRRNDSFAIGSTDRLVIEFGNSSESESDACEAEPPGLASLLTAARNNSSHLDIREDLPASIKKLTIDKQLEYVRLKREIAKREKNVDTAKPLLAANEQKYSQLREAIRNKRNKLMLIKESVSKKKDQYLKADAHAKKMQELLAAAHKMVQHTMSELQRLGHELAETQQTLVAESAEVRAVDEECLRLGKEVQGATYVQPSKRVSKIVSPAKSGPNPNLIAERNRLMARQSAILHLVQKRNSGKASFVSKQKVAVNHQRRLPSLSALRKCNITRLGRENKDPKSVTKTKKKRKAAKEENFEQSVALLFDRHLKEKAKEESAAVSAVDNLVAQPEPILVPYTESVFMGMPSLRLSPLFYKVQSLSLISNTYSHAVDPFQVICYFDLHGVCKDPKCEMQHKSSYLLKDREKLMDIASYQPSVAGLLGDDLLDKQKVYERLENFVDLFAASQSSKSPEELAKQLISLATKSRLRPAVRSGRPNYSHQTSFDVKHFKFAFNGELNSDGSEVALENSDSDDDDK